MEQLKAIENTLMSTIQSQMGNLHNVDTKELGEAIDMIKDLEEAMYYCTITKAMEEKKDDHNKYYIPYDYDRDMDRNNGKMYYDDHMMSGAYNNGRNSNG